MYIQLDSEEFDRFMSHGFHLLFDDFLSKYNFALEGVHLECDKCGLTREKNRDRVRKFRSKTKGDSSDL